MAKAAMKVREVIKLIEADGCIASRPRVVPMIRYAVVIEKDEDNYSAYCPDVPGCAAVGDTLNEVLDNMKEALEFHLEGLAEDGDACPVPLSIVDYVDVREPAPPRTAPQTEPRSRADAREKKRRA
jgi:predicted RNase H-like HicB family nuclease